METALNILYVILIIGMSYFLNAAVVLFLKCFYDPGFQWGIKKSLIMLLFLLIDIGIQLLFGEVIAENTFLLLTLAACEIVGGIFVVIYDYDGKRFRGILRYIWVYTVVFLCTMLVEEIGCQFIFPEYSFETMNVSHSQTIITNSVCILFFALVFFYLYYRVYKRGLFFPWKKREKIFAIIYSVLCVIVAVVIDESGKNSENSLRILGITFILFAILLPVSVYGLLISQHFEQRTKLQELYLQSELEHFRQYMHAQEETRRFRHDIQNNLLCMSDMVAAGNYDKLEQYLKDLLETTHALSFRYASGDELLDSILNSKARVMEQQGIRFSLDGVLAGGLPWKPMDICAVFANALDNAIEACEKVAPEKRSIVMEIKGTPQFWLVSIENAVAGQVDVGKIFRKNGGYTSKKDAAAHGIGTYSMKQTVEAYGDMLTAECTQEVFRLEILIDKRIS